MGSITAYCKTFLACSKPPTSSHFTFGFYLTIACDNPLAMPCSSLSIFLSLV